MVLLSPLTREYFSPAGSWTTSGKNSEGRDFEFLQNYASGVDKAFKTWVGLKPKELRSVPFPALAGRGENGPDDRHCPLSRAEALHP